MLRASTSPAIPAEALQSARAMLMISPMLAPPLWVLVMPFSWLVSRVWALWGRPLARLETCELTSEGDVTRP